MIELLAQWCGLVAPFLGMALGLWFGWLISRENPTNPRR